MPADLLLEEALLDGSQATLDEEQEAGPDRRGDRQAASDRETDPATAHTLAAVVRPWTTLRRKMITPAPRKPMPLTTCAESRMGSKR